PAPANRRHQGQNRAPANSRHQGRNPAPANLAPVLRRYGLQTASTPTTRRPEQRSPLMPSPLRLSRAKSAPAPTSGAGPIPRSASKVARPSWMPRWPRVPVSVRRVVLLLGVVAAVVGLPGPAQAAVSPAAAALSA